MIEFWARAESASEGTTLWYLSNKLSPSANVAEHSCRQKMSTPEQAVFSTLRQFCALFLKVASMKALLIDCHAPSGDTRFMVWTSTASKMAKHNVCNGMECCSSSRV